MSRYISRAESWERVYSALENINFASYDYLTVKQSLLDYVRTFFPEFNDTIESSELIAIIETFAYVAEQIAYRLDVTAHENFISTAQRRDSVLRLAKLVSYNASRPIPARGFVKIMSVRTTEKVYDSYGVDLSGVTIKWDDPANSNWKEQFILAINRVLKQRFGTTASIDKQQLQNVVFETYETVAAPRDGVFKLSVGVGGTNYPFDLVSTSFSDVDGIVERRPYRNSRFNLLYASDGLGDASPTTGFLCMIKQGQLRRVTSFFDGVTPNIVVELPFDNVNNSDIWVNNVDPVSGTILNNGNVSQSGHRYGEWEQVVDPSHNIAYNTLSMRQKFETETIINNRVRVVFGDGEFADIPNGTFDIWVRTSVDEYLTVPASSITNEKLSFVYEDVSGRNQTFTFEVSLTGSLVNNAPAETTDHIRSSAPSSYFTQNRMVSAEDYNTYLLRDSSILKMRAVNRTFVGDSQYANWHDPSQTYENVKVFGNDGVLYVADVDVGMTSEPVTYSTLIDTYIEPLLESSDVFTMLSNRGILPQEIRRRFSIEERERILVALTPPPYPINVEMYYNFVNREWYAIKSSVGTGILPNFADEFFPEPLITVQQYGNVQNTYVVSRLARRMLFHSPSTAFWSHNDSNTVTDVTTLSNSKDRLILLQANVDSTRQRMFESDISYDVVGVENVSEGMARSTRDNNTISLVASDVDGDGHPDKLTIDGIASPSIVVKATTTPLQVPLPISFVTGDVTVTPSTIVWSENVVSGVGNQITIADFGASDSATITVKECVYFKLNDEHDWILQPPTNENVRSWITDSSNVAHVWRRYEGRNSLNFLWLHTAAEYELVDPAPTNIHDIFILTHPYYIHLKRWLSDSTYPKPTTPTPLELRLSYGHLLRNKMMSDTVVLKPGKVKLLFGNRAETSVQAVFKVVRSDSGTHTNDYIKYQVAEIIKGFFDLSRWEFGETFYFSELSAVIHSKLQGEISSIVLVPASKTSAFGSLYEIQAMEDEILYADVSPDQIEIVNSLTDRILHAR